MRANVKLTAGFTLRSRLPWVYGNRQAVDAGGLLSYGADEADSYRRVAYYVDGIPEGSQARRSAGGATDEVRVRDQCQSGQANRLDDPAERAGASGQGY